MATRTRSWTEPLVVKLIERHRGRPPEQIIEGHAERLRRDAQQDSLPIDVGLIATVAGIKRRRGTWDFAGRIYADGDGQLVMDLNDRDGDERQRFTCGHELMHLAFPGFKREARYRLETRQPGEHPRNAEEEFLCDLGAAALLMPAELVSGAYFIEKGLAEMERLADDAQVSLEAAGNQLVSLADQPAAFLVLQWSHKPADRPRLRRGEDVPQRLRLRYATVAAIDAYLPRFKGAADESAFCRAWHGTGLERGLELLPGVESLGPFEVEARAYGTGDIRRVLALAQQPA
jgi:IrrE N-terminal-like domain